MSAYVLGGIVGGFVSLYFYFLIFYGLDANILKEFWKDVLQNHPIKEKRSLSAQRMYWEEITTAGRFSSMEIPAYPTPSIFWLKITKYFVARVFVGMGIVHIL